MATIKHRFEGVDYIDAAELILKHKDYVHVKNLYVMMHEWMTENGYGSRKDQDYPEILYYQKEHPKAGKEIWVWWRTEKPGYGGNKFLNYRFDVDMHAVGVRDAEVVHHGKKFKTNWGEPEIKIWAKLEIDPGKKWRNHWLMKSFYVFFKERLYKNEIEQHRIMLYRDALRLHDAIKRYLKMKTYIPEDELHGWLTEKGLGEP